MKKNYLIWEFIRWQVMLVPILIYSIVQLALTKLVKIPVETLDALRDQFPDVAAVIEKNMTVTVTEAAIGLTLSGVCALALIGAAFMLQMKNKSVIALPICGMFLIVLSNIGALIGWGLLILTASYAAAELIHKYIVLHYKERWYSETGRTVIHTRSLD